MPLADPAADLAQHGRALRLLEAPAPAGSRRRAREAAAVLDLDEGPHAVEPDVRPDAADRSDVAGHERRRALAREPDDLDVPEQTRERVARRGSRRSPVT